MKQTHDWELDSLDLSQCGNFSIFLINRFYVKSIFEIQEGLNMSFFAILDTLNFDFSVIFSLDKRANIHKKQNSEPLKLLKWEVLRLKICHLFYSRKIDRVPEKF